MHDAGRDNVAVAIVGMACRLPGARNLDEFWRLVVSGGDATGSLPDDVFDRDLYYDPRRGVRGKSYSAVGGLVPRVPFDNDKCRLDPEKLKNYDPAHLIACEVAHDALRDAGYDPHAMPSLRSGTYFGHTGGTTKAGDIVYSSYIEQSASLLREVAALEGLSREEIDRIAAEIIQEVRERCDHRVSSPDFDGSPNNLARTIASAFHLDGPCIVVDAACASSLQALALGARALQLGEADMVVTGGASCCKSDSLVLFSAAQSISDGKSCPFDEKASGLVTAEGYIALVMKTLPRALADGDRIRCLVRGIGVAADGRGKSLWAPRKEGQVIAMERAYPEGIKPEHVQYVEAHATSTQVGDATELAALAEAFSDRAANTKVPLGSVKANIGHTLETAGVAGLVKAALAMEKETIPPVANLTQPNSTVAWDEMPFYLPLRTERWESPGDGTPRRAAVNSFGIGGLNVHVLLEEYTPRVAERSSGGPATAPSSEPGEPIAIVGMGTMLPGARNVDEYWQLLESGRDVKTQAPEDRWDATRWVDPSGRDPYRPLHGRGGFLTDYKYDWRRHRVPPKQVANANPLQFMLLDATEQALEQAGYLKKEFDHRRVGVIVGTIFGGDFPNQLQVGLRLPEFGRSLRRYLSARGLQSSQIDKAVAEYEDVLLNKMPALLDETGSFTSSTLASRITKTFDLKGGALAMDAGDGSGLAPLGASMDVLRTGECDMMICATGQRNMDSFAFESLSRSGRLGDEKGEHPFDAGGDGFLPAEGCAVLLLKRLSDARRDGDQILAVLSGMGSGPHAPRQGAEEQSAIEQALAATAIGPADVQFVETTALGKDEARRELQEIQHALAVEPRHRPVQVNTLIRQFGYFGAAHAIAGILKGILAIAHGRYPGGPVASSPDPQLPFSEAVQPQRTCVSLSEGEDTVIGISARGPSGPTYATFVEPVSRAVARRARRTVPAEKPTATPVASHHIIRIGARDWQTLYNQLQNGSVDQLYDPHYRFSGSDRSRLAIVCRDQADFTEKLAEAIARLPRPNVLAREQLAAHGIYFGAPSPVAGGVGFLFPGQGSQYAGMLGSLIDELPAADVARRRADAAMKALNYSDFRTIAGPNATDLGSDIWKTQVSMLLGNCILEETLRQLGLAPTVVAGHSFGEYAALVCAGVWSLTDAIRATRHRYESIEGSAAGSGRMAATNAPLEEVQSILATVGGDVFVANRNAPDQTVISGHQAPVQEAIARLKKRGHTAMLIKVPCPFHTPLMASTADALAERLQDVSLRDPRVPVISTATATKMLSAEEVRQSLKNQLVEPVKYGEILEEVLAMRPALVVEVGPRQTLTQLNKKNHPQDDVLFLASDVLRRPGAMTLLGVLAQAECLGCQEIEARRKQGAAKRAEDQAGRLLVFDATERRTTKMRARAKSGASSTPAGGVSRPTGGSAASPGGNGSQRRPQPVDATAERSARQHGTGTASKTNAATPQPSPQASVRSEAPQPQMATASKPVGASEAQPNRVSQLASAPSRESTPASRQDLQRILVGFVIDQTGYPEEIIELDADLEADLGIDSIKKAQLFGEVGERFQIAPREDLSLDDFPTLNHVLDFLVQELGGVDGGAAVGETEAVGAKAPEKTVADEASAHANPASAAPGTEESTGGDAPAAVAGGPGREELRDILVGFVIDQTGYPEEIIELDADLEADLGIDSIKKAQLFGEVGERFQIAPREDLSLDDFPTLNHVLDFLVQELGAAENDSARAVETVEDEPQSVETVGDERQAGGVDDRVEAASVADSTSTLDSAAEAASRDASVVRLESVQVRVLTGTPRELGRCHGSTLQETIRRELYSMVDVNGPRISGDAASKWPEPWREELTALAQAVEVNRAAVTNWNQQADPLSALPTSFATTSVQPLPPSQRGATVLMQVRKPNSGLEYLTFGRPGKLFAPFGINGARVAVSCEPLDETVSAEDVIGVACWMHQELGESRAIADAAPRLRQLSLQGRWSIGMHVPGSGASRFWLCESGRVRSEETGATPEQNHVHSMLEKDSDTIVLVDRRTGLTEQVMLDDWLRPVTARATVEPEAEPDALADALADASMKRHVLRMTAVERPRPATPVYRAGAHVAVLGDSEVAEPLCSQLGALGCRVIHVGDQDLATAFESSRAGDLPGHVILASESSTEHPALEAFQAARHFESLFHACRRWIAALEQADAMAGASLVGVTRMGGDFGFHSSVAGFTGGGITGLLKGIRREYPAIRVKAIDFDDGALPETVAAEVTGEVNSESTELEIGFRSGQRYLVQAVATPGPSEREELSRGGVWVVSGGGRGVTFAVVRELARRHDLKLHLLGRAPVPEGGAWRGKSEQDLRELKQQTAIQARREGRNPGDAWRQIEKEMELDRNLASVREEGLQVTYHCCDVGDRTQLAAVLQRIRQREGTIDGILHGAGVEAAARFTRKKDPLVRATIASKCDGLSNLIALTREDPLKWFLGFGSTSGRFGGLGQADYSLASDLMAKMMDRLAYERPECRAVGFHWPAWDEVGMAVRPESRMALEHGGISFMPVAEGVAHVIAEISGPRREREILILDKPDVLDTDGTMTRDAEPCEPGVFQTEQAGDVSPTRASGRAAPAAVTGGAGKSEEIDVSRVPLIDSIRSGDEPGSYEALVTLDPRHDPFLVHHRFRDQPFLPAVISMELFAEAACLTRPGARFQSIRALRIDEGWSLPATGKAQEARVLLRPTAEGVRCELRGARCDSNGKVLDGNRLFVSGVVELGSEPARIEPIDPGQPVLAWTPFVYPDQAQIVHGPPLQAFKKLDFMHGGGRAILSCGPTGELFGDRPGDAVQVASALLDGCLVACGAYSYFMVNQKIEMPKGMESYRQARLPRPEEICTLRFFLGETMSEGHVYDFTLMGDQGDAIFQVEGYQSFQLGNMI
ncbi:MAG: beta-ketoacyl synthase N-terminal-like domain-containing protein [Planctomycetota bacterium]